MAYMSQEHKAEIAAVVKPILKKYGVKGSLSVHNHSTISLNIKSGKLDFALLYKGNPEHFAHGYYQVNQYHLDSAFFGRALKFLEEVNTALHGPRFFDKSDIMTDYFHCSHYISINIGKWNKPYEVTK